MMRRARHILIFTSLLITLWGVVPDMVLACERCFGAGADSATVRAISASMMVLIVLMGFMGGGIFSFFSRASGRAAQIEADRIEADRIEADRIEADRIEANGEEAMARPDNQ